MIVGLALLDDDFALFGLVRFFSLAEDFTRSALRPCARSTRPASIADSHLGRRNRKDVSKQAE